MISESKKFIFIHIPKTGGNSITTALKQYTDDGLKFVRFDGEVYNGISVYNSKNRIVKKHSLLSEYEDYYDLDGYFIFTVIRNPFDRMLSWYFYEKKEWDRDNFNRFLLSIDPKKDYRFSSQKKYVLRKDGTDGIDHRIHFDNLQEGFDEICVIKDIPCSKLLHVNKSRNSEVDYHDFYDDFSVDMVTQLYGDDLDYFRYKY